MSDRIQRLTGHPERVQRLVDGDLAATLQGPASIGARLSTRERADIEACYRALLDRAWQDRTAASRDAAHRAHLADTTTDRTGGRR